MHKDAQRNIFIFFIAINPPSVVHGLTLEKFSNQTPIEVSSTVNMTTSSTNIRWGSEKKKTLSCGKVYGKKMYEKWKKANFLLNTSHLSDHFSWHSFRFPLSVAELSNVNDWQLYFLIGKQLMKKIFFLRFFSQEEKEIMFPENILSRNLSQQKRTRTLKTCHIIEFDRPSYFLSTPEISQYGEI